MTAKRLYFKQTVRRKNLTARFPPPRATKELRCSIPEVSPGAGKKGKSRIRWFLEGGKTVPKSSRASNVPSKKIKKS